jgi:lipid-A-disaccharide synthase
MGHVADTKRLLVVCGEPSGDLYAAELVRHLRADVGDLHVRGLGGDRLAAEGALLHAHLRDLAVVGLTEVVRHLGRLRAIFRGLLADVDAHRPQAAVLIDYPDFNLRLARELHRRGIPVLYYVSPQLWAWRAGRMRTVRRHVAHMLVIFPFEEALYRSAGVPVTFVGHPLVELVQPPVDSKAFLTSQGLDPARPVVALLPGSRPGELAHNLPTLLDGAAALAARRPDVQPVLALAPSLDPAACTRAVGPRAVRIVQGQTPALVGSASVALVASGTATVETALLGTPMVVVYRVSRLTYLLGRPLLRVSRFAMVNLIAGRDIVTELIQDDFTAERVASEALALLDDPERAAGMRADLAEVKRALGSPGASARAAAIVARYLGGALPAGPDIH